MKKIKLSDLTLREKIGQTGIVQSPALINMESRGEMEAYLKDNPIGVWHTCNAAMKAANLEYLECDEPKDSKFYREWVKRYKKCLKVPPFIALDPPSSVYATDVPNHPSAPHVGAVGQVETARTFGKNLAIVAKSLGANWIWGTEVDMPSRFAAGGMCRQMSSQPEKLVSLANAMVDGGQDEGVVMTVKHFPGADGKEYRDSHFCSTINKSSLDEWLSGQGKVFKEVIDGGALSVMIAHRGFPAVDNAKVGTSYVPSTISYNVITKLLKERLGFEGIVVTDAIDMAGVKTIYPTKKELYVALLNAGNDVVLGVNDFDYVPLVEEAVKEGLVSEERIDDACRRILAVKEKMGFFDDDKELEMTEEIYDEISGFNASVAEKALCLECDRLGQIPLNKDKVKNVAILCFSHTDYFCPCLSTMKEEFEKRGAKVRLQRRVASFEEMQEISDQNDLIIYAAYVAPHAPMGGSGLFCEECESLFYALTAGREKSIGVSMFSPYVYYDYFVSMDTYIHTFGRSPQSQIALVKALYGEIPFSGIFPYQKPWEEDNF